MSHPSAGNLDPSHPPPAISVVMRSRNDIGIIEATLDGLLAQSRRDFELVALDNDSADGTREAIEARGFSPVRVPAGSYNPGRVLNHGVALARGRWIVFLNSDCVPQDRNFLAEIVAPLERGEADAVYGRQVARRDANALVRRDHDKAFGAEPPAWGPFFSLAASAFPRALLLERPLPESVQYSEDLAWAVGAAASGLRIRYAPRAVAAHSHNYTLREYAKRFFEEGRADAAIFAARPKPIRPLRTALGWAREVAFDAVACARSGEWATLMRAPAVRGIQRAAYVAGRLRGPRALLRA